MKKAFTFILFIFSIISYLSAQSVVGAGGQSASNSAGSFTSTIGEGVFAPISSSEFIITHGFQQSETAYMLSVSNSKMTFIKVYPNPIKENLNINIGYRQGNLTYLLANEKGQKIKSGLIKQSISIISFANIPTGLYFIVITDGKNIYKEKIIKL